MSSVTRFRGANDAAAPVVGIVLLVALVVTVATVVSFSVLGLGGVGDAAPSASWSADVVDATPNDGDAFVVFTHRGGEAVVVAGLEVVTIGGSGNASLGEPDPDAERLSAGDAVAITIDGGEEDRLSAGTEVALVWSTEEQSTILHEVTLEADVVIGG